MRLTAKALNLVKDFHPESFLTIVRFTFGITQDLRINTSF